VARAAPRIVGHLDSARRWTTGGSWVISAPSMVWHDDPWNPTGPTRRNSRAWLVPRRASSGISTRSPGSLLVEAWDDGDDGDACDDAGSIDVRCPVSRGTEGCGAPRDAHRRHRDGSGLHHLIPRFLVIGVVGLVVARRTVGRPRATRWALFPAGAAPCLAAHGSLRPRPRDGDCALARRAARELDRFEPSTADRHGPLVQGGARGSRRETARSRCRSMPSSGWLITRGRSRRTRSSTPRPCRARPSRAATRARRRPGRTRSWR
jgi:hypothetical protein